MTPTQTVIIGELIILLAVALLSAKLDAGVWKRKGISKAGHVKRAIGRGLFMAVQSHAAFSFFHDSYGFYMFWLLQACIWWLVFDLAINLFRGKEAFYVGRTAVLDRIFWSISETARGAAFAQLFTKIAILIVLIILI